MTFIRELKKSDLKDGFFDVLDEFRPSNSLGYQKSDRILKDIDSNQFHEVYVAIMDARVVGCCTVIVERKFIHNCGSVGHIEDLVVSKDTRGLHIAEELINHCILFAKSFGCYKVLADCRDSIQPFLEKNGFRKHEHAMRMNLGDV